MAFIKMRVARRRPLTAQITEFVLVPLKDMVLPPFTPGAHITVKTPAGAMRRYSLVGGSEEPKEYVIAVKREPFSRGGSASMHDDALEGAELEIEPPENDFSLTEADRYLLIAGGIGVTPIYSMAQELKRQNKPFDIIYCTRSPEETAYLTEMTQAFSSRLLVHHDQGDRNKVYDFWGHFEEPQKTHVFCCGPQPLMEEIKALSGHWPEGRVHFEDFKPVEVVRANDIEFDVELARSGEIVTVPADRSILETLRDTGHRTVSSCESGTCGTCKTRLIEGDVDHRDMVLMDHEKGNTIMICVSRAKSGRLVLDL